MLSQIRNPSIHISSYRKQSLLLQELLQKMLSFLPLALRLAPCALRLSSICILQSKICNLIPLSQAQVCAWRTPLSEC
jgi:hypothetical protein